MCTALRRTSKKALIAYKLFAYNFFLYKKFSFTKLHFVKKSQVRMYVIIDIHIRSSKHLEIDHTEKDKAVIL